MTALEIMRYVDHTLLKTTCKRDDIFNLCEEAIKFNTASVCIPPCFVGEARKKFGSKLNICTVIGFPNGYSSKETKIFETADAIKKSADEIDMVINQCFVKDKKYEDLTDEINAVKKACNGKILKVIVETCNLSEQELVEVCKYVSDSDADFIKTSTGFAEYGATFEAVEMIRNNIRAELKIKASGGIRTREDMIKYIELGCERLGTSSAIKILRSEVK
ncbi:MAG: deoxyribose-phosphate aldolase [Ruminococcaceae bacterium]|nr:deoxyribose-phosphate aldolase [Oscillospiraceae bacterium]